MRVSIRTRMTLSYTVVFLVSIGLVQVLVYAGLNATMTRALDKELSTRAVGLDDFLNEHLGRFPLPRVLADLQIHVTLQPALTIIQNQQGHTLYCGIMVQRLCANPAPTGISTQDVARGIHLRVKTETYTVHDTQYRLLVASDLHLQRELLERFRNLMLLIIPAALLCAALGGYWLSGRAFAPIFDIISSVKSINDRSLSLRLRVPTTGDEIQLLCETLNGMLARVEASFRQVTELTANASHELRTPIAIIRAASEVALLNVRPTVASHRKALLQINVEAEKNTRLLEGMLLLARSDAGVQALNFGQVVLYESVSRAFDACKCLADAKTLQLTLVQTSQPLVVWADAVQLHRLWLLLIDNAIKYTPRGGMVGVTLGVSPNSQPICEIADTGIGIATADLPHIYDRFFRADNARQQSEGGSGLGLTMVKWIAEIHRLEIVVTSELDKGSVFRISFPAVKQPVPTMIDSIGIDLFASQS